LKHKYSTSGKKAILYLVMELKALFYDLFLQHPFQIAHDARSVQKSLILHLYHKGYDGYGEATASNYYNISQESMLATLQKIPQDSLAVLFENPEQAWDQLSPFFSANRFAQCALDAACWDWHGRMQQQKVYELWGLHYQHQVVSNYTIGIDQVEKMVHKLQEKPWPLYKIKLGTDNDLEIVQALRQHTSAPFRVDANCAWTARQTLEYAEKFLELGVEFIEQPLKAHDRKGMAEVYRHSPLPIVADESCILPEDVALCAGYFHGVNIKLMKCGGLTPALRMLREARNLGLKTMVGCMTESSVGIAAIAHLLPLLDYVDMDGPLLLAHDIAQSVTITPDGVLFPNTPGLGIQLKSPALQTFQII
jgi:L-alanine-DL-glutamate epimerase-like enolase superfamily enzyme